MNIDYLHPMIAHFPIALLIMAYITDIASYIFKNSRFLEPTAYYLMICGSIGALAAFLSGFLFTEHPREGAIYDIFEKHQMAAIITTALFAIATVLRISMKHENKDDKFTKAIFLILYTLGIIGIFYTSHHGSILVYDFMVK